MHYKDLIRDRFKVIGNKKTYTYKFNKILKYLDL